MSFAKRFPKCGHRSRFPSHRLIVELLENRTLLSFITSGNYLVGFNPISVAVGDFNGDGHADLAVASKGSDTVTILRGIGDGTFGEAQTSYAVGSYPWSVAVGDFNGDGHPDLVVVSGGYVGSGLGTVRILLGNGDGTFQDPQSYTVGSNALSVAVADFNGDGHLDLAVANNDSETVSILLGNGDGTFAAAQNYAVGSYPFSVAAGDFNGDGIPDLAVANSHDSTVGVLLSKGDGTFGSVQTYFTHSSPRSVAVGDFNGDGNLDIATDGAVLLGNGDGSFQAAQRYAVGSGFIAVSDFNGDGYADLALSQINETVTVFLGKGDGTFQLIKTYAAGGDPVYPAVGDFNGDGHPDLAVPNNYDSTVSILLGKGNGTFVAAESYAIGANSYGVTSVASVATADFNGDGHLDLVTANNYDGTVSILLGKGDGTFEAAQSYAVGVGLQSVAVGDFNSDGHLDLAVANVGTDPYYSDGNVNVMLGNGDGTFQPARSYAVGHNPQSVAAEDFNSDGHLDLAVANYSSHTVSILLGNGDGTFRAAQNYAVPYSPHGVAVGDFNGDGYVDLAVTNGPFSEYYGVVSILLGDGEGSFRLAYNFPVGFLPQAVVVGDLNGDGVPDLALVDGGTYPHYYSTVRILLGIGDGSFQAPQSYIAGSRAGASSVAIGDFNGDGIPDVVVPTPYLSNTVSILLGKGDGTFEAAVGYAAGSQPGSVAVGDFNADNFPDLAVGSGGFSGTVAVLLNAADWSGGGPAPSPARRPTLDRAPSRQPATVTASLPERSQPRTLPPVALSSTDFRPEIARPWPVESETSQPAGPEESFVPRSIYAARHAQDSVFKRWIDPVVDLLAWNLLR